MGTQAGADISSLEAKLVRFLRRRRRGTHGGDLAATVRHCLAEAVQQLHPRTAHPGAGAASIAGSAARWAREGIALETVLGAYHEGIRQGLEFLADHATADDASDASAQQLLAGTQLMVRVLELVTVTASAAYLDEHRLVAREHQTAAQTLVSALLSGHGASALARRTGIAVAPAYQVVALAIPPHPDELDSGIGAVSAGRRKLRRVQAALAAPLGSRSLSLLSADGGTVLIPQDPVSAFAPSPAMTGEVLEVVGEAAEVALTAVVISGPTERIPDLAGRAHDVLEHVRGAGHPAGLYRITEGGETDSGEAGQWRYLPVAAADAARFGRSA
ncbi:transcriptional regulator [Nocardia cyriacigeorgica]|uniref:Transcriptional regulator n=1 Tax=Nocardia cyriacigeorgica TaxID=135487 RepID=A0A5R8PK69_9NOCA|nr:transcriptional regulator [Nocardia cyriacigeorgica]TLG15756.1 transcriptional regulator [Nocardia cyriacigeorgica]